MSTQVQIARKTGLDVSTVNKILHRKKGVSFKKETIRKVFKAAREMGYDFKRIKFAHRRRHTRRQVNVPVTICVYQPDGRIHDLGKAVLKDISRSGARIGEVHLPGGTLPASPFTLTLSPVGRERRMGVLARIVRVLHEPPGYGLEFDLHGPAPTSVFPGLI